MRPPAASAAARRASTCSRATDTSTCIACRSGLAGSRSCIQTVDPWPSGSTALSSASSAYPRTARQKPTSTVVGLRRDGELDLLRTRRGRRRLRAARATAETARASSTCRGSSRQTPRVNRTVSRSSAIVISTPDAVEAGDAARPRRQAAPPRRATGRGTPPSLRRATPPSRRRPLRRGSPASPARSCPPPTQKVATSTPETQHVTACSSAGRARWASAGRHRASFAGLRVCGVTGTGAAERAVRPRCRRRPVRPVRRPVAHRRPWACRRTPLP